MTDQRAGGSPEVTDGTTAGEEPWRLADGSFIVLAMREGQGLPIVTAVPLRAEWSAHDVAESYIALGCRAFFIDTDGSDGVPTIEEYGRG